jgi:hypothetical protein
MATAVAAAVAGPLPAPATPRVVSVPLSAVAACSAPIGTVRRTTYARAERVAERAAAAAQPAHATVATIFAGYLADKGKARARDAWRRLAPRFEALAPAQVTRQACRDYLAARRRDGACAARYP